MPFGTIDVPCLGGKIIPKLDRPARLSPNTRLDPMALTAPVTRRRAENRIPQRMFVRLSLPDSNQFEMAQTIDISRHGACVATKKSWQPDQHLLLRSLRGNFTSYARVVHCEFLAENSYSLGLELYNPVGDWTASTRSPHRNNP